MLPEVANGAGLNLIELLSALGRRRVASVLVEGGRGVITSLLSAQLGQPFMVVVLAPKIIGQGLWAVGEPGHYHAGKARLLSLSIKTRRLGRRHYI